MKIKERGKGERVLFVLRFHVMYKVFGFTLKLEFVLVVINSFDT